MKYRKNASAKRAVNEKLFGEEPALVIGVVEIINFRAYPEAP